MRRSLSHPLVAMVCTSVVAGAVVMFRPAGRPADLQVWSFDEGMVEAWRNGLVGQFELRTGMSVSVKQVSTRAIDTRLESLFMSGEQGRALPDLVTLEINSVGKFFRPPAEEVGFLPLEPYLKRDGLSGTFLASRLAPWGKGGHVFGLPCDVHPVTITYRKDLFERAGIDLAGAGTWAEFQERCLAFQAYWASRGRARAAIELPGSQPDVLYMMLLQRGVNLLDAGNDVHFDDPKVAETILFYAQLVVGERKIGVNPSSNQGLRFRELAEGNVCAMVTPDWLVPQLKLNAPDLKGKVAMMALPRFEAGDSPTATWGGTMLGIPRHARDPEVAWGLMKHLLLSAPTMDTLPAVPSLWSDARFHQEDDFYGGQKIGELYIELAKRLPSRVVTPFSTIALGELGLVLHRATGRPGDATPAQCRVWLQAAGADVQRYVRFGEFQ